MADIPNTAEPAKPRRHWYQFTVRTLLIGVVLIGTACGYVAHEWRIVKRRQAWLIDHRVSKLPHTTYTEPSDIAPDDMPSHPEKAPGLVRRWLGDGSYSSFSVSPDEKSEVESLFPEAEIDTYP